MAGMFMCAIHKQEAWGFLAFYNKDVQGRETPNWAAGGAAKFQSSDHQTAPIHVSSLWGEVFLATPL